MFSAFLLALTVACNSEPPETEVPAEADDSLVDAAPETLDTRQKVTSVVEIPRPRFHARHILIAHIEASSAHESVTRSPQQAQAEADRLLKELNSGADFETLARAHSDDGSKSRGGDLGVFTKGVMHTTFEAATIALEEGQVSQVVETPFGFHIIERLPVIEVHVSHILVQWEGLKRTRSSRTREEAVQRIEQAQALLDSGTEFADVAAAWSDGPFGKRGGDLGWFQKGQMAPQFDDAAFSLQPGERSTVVESPHGFHLILRNE